MKTYRLFEDIGPEQIYRTKFLTITYIHNIPVTTIDQAKDLTQMINNFQPEVENQERKSVTLEEFDNDIITATI